MALLGAPGPIIVWLRVGNTRRRALLVWFESHLDELVVAVEAGNRLIELR